MKIKKAICLFLMISLVVVSASGCKSDASDKGAEGAGKATPRNQTLYLDGIQWSTPTNFNPLNAAPAACITSDSPSVARELVYETLFMYNQLDGKIYPLLATGYQWSADKLTCTVTLNSDAHWSDGKPLTADDVVYTFELGKKYSYTASSVWEYLSSVSKTDDHTVVFAAKSDNVNPLMIEDALESVYILPMHVWGSIEAKDGNSEKKILAEVNADPVASGPYKLYYYDKSKWVLSRDDNYWGQAASMWGKLPAPKYITHNIYKDAAAGDTALKAGQVDVSQQFSTQIWTFGSNVKTYLSSEPYYIPGCIPNVIFNTTRKGLDNASVRKAIAMVADYDKISKNAMSGYSGKVVPSLMLPTDNEQSLIDEAALAAYQWKGNQVDEANALLDSIGAVKGADGIRVLNGTRLSYKIECPTGWTDWNATLQIIADATKSIGIDLRTYFPQSTVFFNDMYTGGFDMVMWNYQGLGISSPWQRAFQTMSSKGVPEVGEPAYRNMGRYQNPEVDKLIDQIPTVTDPTELKKIWTELNIYYLKDVPAFGTMYRPQLFYSVNDSVWTGFPMEYDGSNIPPQACTDGYGVAALYKIQAK